MSIYNNKIFVTKYQHTMSIYNSEIFITKYFIIELICTKDIQSSGVIITGLSCNQIYLYEKNIINYYIMFQKDTLLL